MNSHRWYGDKTLLVLKGELFHDSVVVPPDTNTQISVCQTWGHVDATCVCERGCHCRPALSQPRFTKPHVHVTRRVCHGSRVTRPRQQSPRIRNAANASWTATMQTQRTVNMPTTDRSFTRYPSSSLLKRSVFKKCIL
jgi:hypothetical protein